MYSSDIPASDSEDDFGEIDDEELVLLTTHAEENDLKRKNPYSADKSLLAKRAKLKDEDPVFNLAKNVLKKTWGFQGFRLKQEVAIARLITGGNAAVVFPTGGGKSMVYQVPALAFDKYDELCGRTRGKGVTLVVSPLIALMKDQVDALKKKGVAAAAMDSSQSRESWLDTCNKLRNGRLKLLYVAPERLNNESFIEMIKEVRIRMIAIDEAHCISEWGHAFRPDYLKIARFVNESKAERVLCLTATASPLVASDICKAFDIGKDGLFRTMTYRPNLHLLAQSFRTADEKLPELVKFLNQHKGASIVYVQTHEQTETVSTALANKGFEAYAYHAGMSSGLRTSVQDKFMVGKNIVVVATMAFGMGIDKANIRNVVHYAIPKSLEGYSQEIGRAGRDNLDSTCLIYLCPADIAIVKQWSRGDVPSMRSVEGLVGELIELHKHSSPGEIIERQLFDESKEWDLRKTALDRLYAQLEVRFTLIRAITPKYTKYEYVKDWSFDNKTSDGSKLTEKMIAQSKTARKWTHIDVDVVARSAQTDREYVVRKLQQWNDSGAIELKPSGVVARFRITQKFPQGEQAKNKLISDIYAQIEAREKEDMARVEAVVDFVTSNKCLSRELASHFGDEKSVPEDGCGHCQKCFGKALVQYHGARNCKGRIDHRKTEAILSATLIRDDPRFLARVAFGISSPRVTGEKLGKHPVFGSMDDCDFEELVDTFKKACD